jgi:hypothetical protein
MHSPLQHDSFEAQVGWQVPVVWSQYKHAPQSLSEQQAFASHAPMSQCSHAPQSASPQHSYGWQTPPSLQNPHSPHIASSQHSGAQ